MYYLYNTISNQLTTTKMKATFNNLPSFKYSRKDIVYHVYLNGLNWRCAISGIVYSLTDFNFSSKNLAKQYADSIINNL